MFIHVFVSGKGLNVCVRLSPVPPPGGKRDVMIVSAEKTPSNFMKKGSICS